MKINVRFQLWLWIGLLLCATFLYSLIGAAGAHDVYSDLRSSTTGQLCCGGDPVHGDCEALAYDDVHENIDGTWTFVSRRYKRSVIVAETKIEFMSVAGSQDPVHWCGTVRSTQYSYAGNDQMDPSMWTFCAFISPGGV